MTGDSAGMPEASAVVAETRGAVVMCVGDRAYKMKKPVNLGFQDLRSVDAREAACRREWELNRRLAPDVYLDVCRLLDSEHRTRDWVLLMRRMPAEQRLSTMVAQGAAVGPELKRLARVIAGFHGTARSGPEVTEAGSPDALRKRWTANLAGTQPFVGTVLDHVTFQQITTLALRYIDGRSRLLHDRVLRGYIVDGHGDLRAEDVFCLRDGPRVLDCLEFDDALRYLDGVDDAAQLAVDLEQLGSPDSARDFMNWYREFSGDHVPESLAHHYIAYRAFARTTAACLRHGSGEAHAAVEARQFAELALRHLRAGRARLVLVGGLPGTGKSTVARGLADRMGAILLRTDQIRQRRSGAGDMFPNPGYGRDLYSAGRVHDTYQEMLGRAHALIEHGESVVLDASWCSADERVAARSVGLATSASVTELRCVVAAETASARIGSRAGDEPETGSGTTLESTDFRPWPEADLVDTSGSIAASDAAAWVAVESRR